MSAARACHGSRLLGYGNLVIALIGDVPLAALNAFVLYTDALGSISARYLLTHFLLEIGLVASTPP